MKLQWERKKIPTRQKWVEGHFVTKWDRKGKRNRRKGIINLNVPYHSLPNTYTDFYQKFAGERLLLQDPWLGDTCLYLVPSGSTIFGEEYR